MEKENQEEKKELVEPAGNQIAPTHSETSGAMRQISDEIMAPGVKGHDYDNEDPVNDPLRVDYWTHIHNDHLIGEKLYMKNKRSYLLDQIKSGKAESFNTETVSFEAEG